MEEMIELFDLQDCLVPSEEQIEINISQFENDEQVDLFTSWV